MKKKLYLLTLFSHLAVLIALCTPVIRMTETRMNMNGEKEAYSYYINLIKFAKDDIYSFTSMYMLVLTLVHIVGIANAIVGIFQKEYNNVSVNLTLMCGFASALMGALQLYSKSYALFAICAISFLVIAFCSIKLVKSEK